MADAKRQSVAGRITTPKPAATKTSVAAGPGNFDMSKAIGARVKLVTSAPPLTLEGTLYTACPLTNLVAIDTAPTPSPQLPTTTPQPGNYHVIPISSIQTFTILSLPDSSVASFETNNPQLAISRIDIKALKAREDAAIRKIKEHDATRGKGVTKEAQDIFDAMARTLPCRWHETQIIVNDAVIISSPYTPDSCAAPKDQPNALARVKRVLENERRKLADKAAAAAAASTKSTTVVTPPVAPRKGG